MFHKLSWRSQGHEWLKSIMNVEEMSWRSQGHKCFLLVLYSHICYIICPGNLKDMNGLDPS